MLSTIRKTIYRKRHTNGETGDIKMPVDIKDEISQEQEEETNFTDKAPGDRAVLVVTVIMISFLALIITFFSFALKSVNTNWDQAVSQAADVDLTISQEDKPTFFDYFGNGENDVRIYDEDGSILSGLVITDYNANKIKAYVKVGSKFVLIEKYAESEESK